MQWQDSLRNNIFLAKDVSPKSQHWTNSLIVKKKNTSVLSYRRVQTICFVSMPFTIGMYHCEKRGLFPARHRRKKGWCGGLESRSVKNQLLGTLNYLGQIRNSASQSITWAVPSECTSTGIYRYI